MSLEIEGLGKQRRLPRKEQEARRRNHGRGIRIGEPLGRASIERTGVDTLSRTTCDKVDQMPTIGEKLRKFMALLSGFEACDGHRLATRRGHLQKRCINCGSEDDGSVSIPGASAWESGIGQHLRRAAHDLDAFQFAVRKESY